MPPGFLQKWENSWNFFLNLSVFFAFNEVYIKILMILYWWKLCEASRECLASGWRRGWKLETFGKFNLQKLIHSFSFLIFFLLPNISQYGRQQIIEIFQSGAAGFTLSAAKQILFLLFHVFSAGSKQWFLVESQHWQRSDFLWVLLISDMKCCRVWAVTKQRGFEDNLLMMIWKNGNLGGCWWYWCP